MPTHFELLREQTNRVKLTKAVLAIPKQPQTQISLNEQLLALRTAANRLGLYDAADYLRHKLEEGHAG